MYVRQKSTVRTKQACLQTWSLNPDVDSSEQKPYFL